MDRTDFLEAYPEVNLLNDSELKEVVIRSFQLGIELGKWDEKGTFANCSVAAEGLLKEDCPVTGLEHMRIVAAATSRVIAYLEPWMEKMNYKLDREYGVCAALLHDIGKLIEFDRDSDNIPRYSKVGHMFCHTSAGAYIIKKAGAPDSIVHAVLTHSHSEAPEGHNAYENPELIIVKGCDLTSYESILHAWKQPHIKLVI